MPEAQTGSRRVHKGVEGISDMTPDDEIPANHEFFTSDPTAPEDADADVPPTVTDEAEPPPESAATPPVTADAGAPAATSTEPAAPRIEPPAAADTVAGAPATPPTAAPAGEPEKPGGFPWAQFREAERTRDQLQARLAEFERQQHEAQARLAQVQQAVSPQQAAQPWTRQSGRVPTPAELETLRNEDPLEYNAVTAEMALQQAQAVQQQQQLMQTQMQIRADIDSFQRTQADYPDAARYLEERENKRWMALGFSAEQAQQMTQARAGMVVDAAMRMGRPVPQAIYDLAIADGWQVPQPAAPTNGNGAPAVEPTPAEKVAASKARTQAAQGSLGSVPSGPTKVKGTIDHDEAMRLTEEEMERLDREQPGWDSLL